MKGFYLVMAVVTSSPSFSAAQVPGEWPAYGRDAGGTRYSPLAEITRANVKQLKLAWVYRTGDYQSDRGRFEAAPLMVGGLLYLSTPLGRVMALDPATGAERWTYDPKVSLEGDFGDFANRGVATWLDGSAPAGAVCRRRVYVATVDARLIALDGGTGVPCAAFGEGGQIDLAAGLRNKPSYHYEYGVTSPPVVVATLVVVGSAVSDNQRVNAPEGTVRAFDARTGRLRWKWDPIPPAANAPGAANAWSIISADSVHGLIFVPTGSASPDFYGGERKGDNHHANSVVALRVTSGTVAWSFQVVHHDIWDYDVPAQPVLFTLHRNGREIPAVAVATKMGHLFLLNRLTGEPLTPVEERPVPASDVPGEVAWPSQPFPPPVLRLVPESLAANDVFGRTDGARQWCADRIARLRYQGVFTPPSLRGTIIYPGNIGGMNWSGVSVDETRGLIVAPTNRLAMIVTLIPRDSIRAARMTHPQDEISTQRGTPYGMMREVLLGPDGVPCTAPPWGPVAALDVNGPVPTLKWQTPLGDPGLVNLGGASVTAGGLVFIGGTTDLRLRALDEETGSELWSVALPAGAHALPTTYQVGGRQYVVIAAGGHDRLRTRMGDYVLAFALPRPGVSGADTLVSLAIGRTRHLSCRFLTPDSLTRNL